MDHPVRVHPAHTAVILGADRRLSARSPGLRKGDRDFRDCIGAAYANTCWWGVFVRV